jgi:hypothetical protein
VSTSLRADILKAVREKLKHCHDGHDVLEIFEQVLEEHEKFLERVHSIVERISTYTLQRELPPPDFRYGISVERTIETLLTREELTDDECFEFMICSEEVDSTQDEEQALARSRKVILAARKRRGVPDDRMNDAVSF